MCCAGCCCWLPCCSLLKTWKDRIGLDGFLVTIKVRKNILQEILLSELSNNIPRHGIDKIDFILNIESEWASYVSWRENGFCASLHFSFILSPSHTLVIVLASECIDTLKMILTLCQMSLSNEMIQIRIILIFTTNVVYKQTNVCNSRVYNHSSIL